METTYKYLSGPRLEQIQPRHRYEYANTEVAYFDAIGSFLSFQFFEIGNTRQFDGFFNSFYNVSYR